MPQHFDHRRPLGTPRCRAISSAPTAMAQGVRHALLVMAVAGGVGGLPSKAFAADSVPAVATSKTYVVPAGPLGEALASFAASAGVSVQLDAKLVEGRKTQGLSGSYTVQAGFAKLLGGSGLEVVERGASTYVLRPAPAPVPVVQPSAVVGAEATLPTVRVKANAERETAVGHVNGYTAKRSATGTKTDTPIVETPQSISVVTADRMEAIGATRLHEALGYTPGVNISAQGQDSRYDWLNLRGFDAYAPGFYLDGLVMRNNGAWAIGQTENYGAERVELLRGPASVLYGQNGPGGMVNIVSKRPTAEPLHELQMQLGDHARRQVAGDFSGPLDEDGKLLYRVTGLVRDAELALGGLPDDRIFIAPSLTWRPDSDTTLTVLSHFLRMRTAGTYTNLPEVGTLLPNPNGKISPSTFAGERDFDRFNQDQWMLGYQLEHRLNDTWTLRQNARYGRIDLDYQQVWSSGSFVTVNAGDASDPANFRLLDRTMFGSKEKVSLINLDNQAQAKLRVGDWQHTVLFGLDYQRMLLDQLTRYGGSVAPLDVYAPIYGSSVTVPDPYVDTSIKLAQTGLYVQDQMKFDDRWVLTLGGRYDRATSSTVDRLAGSTTPQSDHKFTSRAGVVYLAPNGWAPYVSYSESFSPSATIDPSTGKPMKPETGRQYEAGMRYQPPGRKDSYSAAVFDLRRQNYVTTDPATNLPRQTGEVTVQGLELEATVQPISHMNLTAAYTFTPKADVTASASPAEVGKQLTPVPKQQLSLWGDYRFATGIKVGLGARYVGSHHGYGESATVALPAYTVFDAMLGYDFASWSLALNARNLTDKATIATCSYGSCSYGDVRRVTATATYRW